MDFEASCVERVLDMRYKGCVIPGSMAVAWDKVKRNGDKKIKDRCVPVTYKYLNEGLKACTTGELKRAANARANQHTPPCKVQ
jgi:hypothetical protein